ncbi:MAG: tetratricopeptide repeat protein [Methanomicrobiales archaeon]
MKRMIFVGILLVVTGLTTGCIFQTGNSLPGISLPPAISNESFVNYGGTSIAIAFKADEISTTSPEAKEQFIQGLTYLTHYGRYNDSLQYFDAALAFDQNFTEAWQAKGVAFHNLRRYDEAIVCYDRARELTPPDAGIWHLKGLTYFALGRPDDAGACNRRAAELDPRYGNR